MAEQKKRSRAIQVFGWLVLLGVIGGVAAYFYTREEIVDVTVIQLTRGSVEETIAAISSGTVKPKADSMVAANLVAKVVDIPVEEGQRVEKDALLIELEHTELDAQVRLSEANLRVGQSRLAQAEIAAKIGAEIATTRVNQASAQLKVAKQDFERIQALTDKKAVSQSDLDKVTLALRVAEETYAAAKAGEKENLVRDEDIRSAQAAVEQLEAALRAAEETRKRAFVGAPFDGVVASINVELGESLGGASALGGLSGGFGAAGALGAGGGVGSAELVQLIDDSDIYVEAPFDEANAAQIKVGQKARINLDAYRGVDFFGTVEFISPTVTIKADQSRTLDVRVRIEEGKEKFIPGMSADVVVVSEEKDGVLFAPSEALIREEEAFVVKDGRAVRCNVEVGIGNWTRREILDGLSEGDALITSIVEKNLEDGVKVQVVDALPTS